MNETKCPGCGREMTPYTGDHGPDEFCPRCECPILRENDLLEAREIDATMREHRGWDGDTPDGEPEWDVTEILIMEDGNVPNH